MAAVIRGRSNRATRNFPSSSRFRPSRDRVNCSKFLKYLQRWGGSMGAIIGWVIFGLIAGAIAKLLMPGKDPGGWIITIVLGIAGAVLGGWIGRALWGSSG